MKKSVFRVCVLLLAVSLLSGCYGFSDKTLAFVDNHAPYTRIRMVDGAYLPLESFSGKTLVLGFWGTWCPFSVSEVRKFDEYAEQYADRSDLAFVAVNLDEEVDKSMFEDEVMASKLNSVKHAFSGASDEDEAFLAFRLASVPAYIVIDPVGTVKAIVRHADDVIEHLD